MAAITSSTHAPIVRFFDSFYSDQSLKFKVVKVFFVCLAVVVAYVVIRDIKAGIEGEKEPVIEGKVWIESKLSGLIGSDGKCRFGKTLQLTNEQFLKVAATDFYVDAAIHYNGDRMSVREWFPSSLFAQARQGDQIRFRRDGKLYHLTLAPSSHDKTLSFDDALANVEDHKRKSLTEFIDTEDVPASYKPWGKRIFLSPETRQVVVGQKGLQPIDLDALQVPKVSQNPNLKQICTIPGQKVKYQLFAYGQSTVTILVDRHHLYVNTVCEFIKPEGDSPIFQELRKCPDGGKTEYFFHGLLVVDGEKVDTENIEAALSDGTLTINIPFLV